MTDKAAILVVDDEERVVNAIRRTIRRDYDTVGASNGREALERLSEREFHAIVSDVRMPVMGGIEFFESLNGQGENYRGRFIFMSGDCTPGQVPERFSGRFLYKSDGFGGLKRALAIAGHKPEILIVDDRKNIRRVLALEMEGWFDVRTADDGSTGLEALANLEADVVLTDVGMSGMNGVDFYRAAQNLNPCYEGRFMFMTGYDALHGIPKRPPKIFKPIDRDGLRRGLWELGYVVR